MMLSLPYNDFRNYVLQQLNHFFPDNQQLSKAEYKHVFDTAIERTSFCFSHINLNSYWKDGSTYLNHLHANQYASFLWFLSNTVWTEYQNDKIANKIYCLNRSLNGLSCSYEAKMPNIFILLHIVGTVLGKADYSDYFVACHGCTVGAHHGIYPRIGRGVAMLPHSAVIGDCNIGERVSLGINTIIYERDIQDNTVAFVDNATGKLNLKQNKVPWVQHIFNVET